jgi:hypothetical protein
MTDFFPTIADIAKTSLTAWKPLDGVTFYDNIIGTPLNNVLTITATGHNIFGLNHHLVMYLIITISCTIH